MKNLLWILLLPFALLAQADKTPAEIEQELQIAEAQFQKAKKMFNPWYTGPLLTASATMMDPGWGNIQPYVFVTDNFGHYNAKRHSDDIHKLVQVNPLMIFQAGITSWMDTILQIQTLTNWQNHQHGGSVGDTIWTVGFPLAKQSLYVPNIKVTLNETFPTGRYQHLKPRKLGTDSTGAGAYQTNFGLALSKVILWMWKHPMNLRLQFNYGFNTTVHVRGLNTYGGAPNTRGTVRPGNTFKTSLGVEYSLSQRWVLATDVVYTATGRNKFQGFAGTLADGSPATVGGGYSDQLSLAPALEYNLNANIGFLGGCWFTVYGRNAFNFASGILSFTYTFPFTD